MPTRDEVRKLFPMLDEMKDESLREKVVDVWTDAMNEGGWEIKDLADIPFTLLIQTDVNLLDHTVGVTKVAMAIGDTLDETYGRKIPINRDYIIAGGILHDVGKLVEYERRDGTIVKSPCGKDLRHPFSGTALAYRRDVPTAVCHLIAVHAKEGEGARMSPEAIIINHADFSNFEPLKLMAR